LKILGFSFISSLPCLIQVSTLNVLMYPRKISQKENFFRLGDKYLVKVKYFISSIYFYSSSGGAEVFKCLDMVKREY
jgi:hypothetical protein